MFWVRFLVRVLRADRRWLMVECTPAGDKSPKIVEIVTWCVTPIFNKNQHLGPIRLERLDFFRRKIYLKKRRRKGRRNTEIPFRELR